jgi:hypothetical protein
MIDARKAMAHCEGGECNDTGVPLQPHLKCGHSAEIRDAMIDQQPTEDVGILRYRQF